MMAVRKRVDMSGHADLAIALNGSVPSPKILT